MAARSLVVDTLAWIEWLLGDEVGTQLDPHMPDKLECVVPTMAADMHRQYKLATADAIVYASALHERAELLTCDAHFRDLPGVRLFAKHG